MLGMMMLTTYVHVNHDWFNEKILSSMPKYDLQESGDEFEHVQLKFITLTTGCNYLCSNAQIEEALRIWINTLIHWMAPCLTVIKSTIQVKKLKTSYNYSSQYTWKSKSYCSSTYWLHALVFRPIMVSILARGINNMTHSFFRHSSTKWPKAPATPHIN